MRFAYRLALAVGRADVSRMLAEMTVSDWHGWSAFYAVEPFGGERDDIMVAQLCAIVANALKGKGGRAYKPDDFIPKYEPKTPTEQQDWRKMKGVFRAYAKAHNAMRGHGHRS